MRFCKHCSRCGDTKPITEFYKDRKGKYGVGSRCAQCTRENNRVWVAANPDRARAQMKRWAEANSERRAEILKNWKRANPERARQLARESAKRTAANRKRWRDENVDKMREYKRAWKKRNPKNGSASAKRRRALRLGAASSPFTTAELEARMRYFGWRCWICGLPASTVDHVKPLAKGGAHMLCNLRPACNVCNARKNDRWPYDQNRSSGLVATRTA